MSHGIRTIVHPTDFSDASALAFAHALRIALAMRSLLYLVHVAESKDPGEYDGFPHVRHVLAQWQLMDESDPPAVVGKLGIKVAKIGLKPHDPLAAYCTFSKTIRATSSFSALTAAMVLHIGCTVRSRRNFHVAQSCRLFSCHQPPAVSSSRPVASSICCKCLCRLIILRLRWRLSAPFASSSNR